MKIFGIKLLWLSLVSESTQLNIFAYNLEKNTCLLPQEHTHWTSNKFLQFYSFQIQGLIYALVDRIK